MRGFLWAGLILYVKKAKRSRKIWIWILAQIQKIHSWSSLAYPLKNHLKSIFQYEINFFIWSIIYRWKGLDERNILKKNQIDCIIFWRCFTQNIDFLTVLWTYRSQKKLFFKMFVFFLIRESKRIHFSQIWFFEQKFTFFSHSAKTTRKNEIANFAFW